MSMSLAVRAAGVRGCPWSFDRRCARAGRGPAVLSRGAGPVPTWSRIARVPAALGFLWYFDLARCARAGTDPRGAARVRLTRQGSFNHIVLTSCSVGPWDRGNPCRRCPRERAGGGRGLAQAGRAWPGRAWPGRRACGWSGRPAGWRRGARAVIGACERHRWYPGQDGVCCIGLMRHPDAFLRHPGAFLRHHAPCRRRGATTLRSRADTPADVRRPHAAGRQSNPRGPSAKSGRTHPAPRWSLAHHRNIFNTRELCVMPAFVPWWRGMVGGVGGKAWRRRWDEALAPHDRRGGPARGGIRSQARSARARRRFRASASNCSCSALRSSER